MKKKEEVEEVVEKGANDGLFKRVIGKLFPANNHDDMQQEEEQEKGGVINQLISIAAGLAEPLFGVPRADEGTDIESLLSLLRSAAEDFGEILASTKALRAETEVSADTKDLVIDFFDLMEDIITTFEGYMIDMAYLLQDITDSTVGLMVGINLGILSVIEDVLVASLDTTSDVLKSMFGISADEVNTEELLNIAADATEFRFFEKFKNYLSSSGDEYGLSDIVAATEVKLGGVQNKVATFIDNAIVTMDSTTEATIQADVAIVDPMVKLISASTNLMVSVITEGLDMNVTTLETGGSEIVATTEGIISSSITVLKGILGTFWADPAEEGDKNSPLAAAQLLFGFLITRQYDIKEVLFCVADLEVLCPVNADQASCEADLLQCETSNVAEILLP
jgi:hypothetical protein